MTFRRDIFNRKVRQFREFFSLNRELGRPQDNASIAEVKVLICLKGNTI